MLFKLSIDPQSGKFKEIHAKQLFPTYGQMVDRVVEFVKSEKEKDLIKLTVAQGTHNYLGETKYHVKVSENGFEMKKLRTSTPA